MSALQALQARSKRKGQRGAGFLTGSPVSESFHLDLLVSVSHMGSIMTYRSIITATKAALLWFLI